MRRINLLLLMISLLFQFQLIAQSKLKSKLVVDELESQGVIHYNNSNYNTFNLNGFIGLTTNYDYFANSVIRDQIVYDKILTTPHLLNMVRGYDLSNPTIRYTMHSYINGGNWTNNKIEESSAGYPQIDIGLTGDLLGLVGGVYHTPSRYFIWDFGTNYFSTQFDPSTDPSIQLAGNTIWLGSSGNRIEFSFYKSVNFGSPFLWNTISEYHPVPIWWSGNGGVEVGMSKSPNENNLIYFGSNIGMAGGGAHAYLGIPINQCDNIWMLKSTNSGSSFIGSMISSDGIINLVPNYHTPNYAPLFEDYGQIDGAIDNNGVVHLVANGYGLVFDDSIGTTAIAKSFPVLYWNSLTGEWKSISDPAIDVIQGIYDYYPTNSIGQAYPSISVSPDGQVLYAIWTGPQLTASGGLDLGDNTQGTLYYWRDLYHSHSTDGGSTWIYGGRFPEMQNDVAETYGHASQHLELVSPGVYRAHIVYLADLTTGVGPFDGVLTNNPIVYTTYSIITSTNPTIIVDVPNGGETWTIGEQRNITWTSSNITNVKLEYSINNGSNWTVITPSTPAASGSFLWTVPNTPSTQVKLRISDESNSNVYDTSDNLFKIISAPNILLTAPNGGENWTGGEQRNITWLSNNISSVKIEYSINNGASWIDIVNSTPAQPRIFSWTIPNIASTQARVRISDAINQTTYDIRDTVFTINNSPTITVTSPNGGETWNLGGQANLTWTSLSVTNVKIELTRNNGTSWNTIVNSVPSSGIYTWTIDGPTSSQCKVRISSANNSSISDISDNVFSIQPITSIDDYFISGIPEEFILLQNFPNPFNPSTTIFYGLPNDSPVEIKIFDILGNTVMVNNVEWQTAGYHKLEFNGSGINSGVYFCRITACNSSDTKKLILIK